MKTPEHAFAVELSAVPDRVDAPHPGLVRTLGRGLGSVAD